MQEQTSADGPLELHIPETVPRLSLPDSSPGQQGAGSSWGKVLKQQQQCRAGLGVCRGSTTVLVVLGLSAELASARKGLDGTWTTEALYSQHQNADEALL